VLSQNYQLKFNIKKKEKIKNSVNNWKLISTDRFYKKAIYKSNTHKFIPSNFSKKIENIIKKEKSSKSESFTFKISKVSA
jgi:predicted HNH restriction endonuclease